ncbi:MAG: hypothetical protein MHMPM18_000241 [Marteilia pararefringens]
MVLYGNDEEFNLRLQLNKVEQLLISITEQSDAPDVNNLLAAVSESLETLEHNTVLDEKRLSNIIRLADMLLIDQDFRPEIKHFHKLASIITDLSKLLPRGCPDPHVDNQPQILIFMDKNCDIRSVVSKDEFSANFVDRFKVKQGEICFKQFQIFRSIPQLLDFIEVPPSFLPDCNDRHLLAECCTLEATNHGQETHWNHSKSDRAFIQLVGWQQINLVDSGTVDELDLNKDSRRADQSDESSMRDVENTSKCAIEVDRSILLKILKKDKIRHATVMLLENQTLYVPSGWWMSSKSMNRSLTLIYNF